MCGRALPRRGGNRIPDICRQYSCNPANYQRGRAQPVSYLVMHYVGATGGAQANAQYYGSAVAGASAHYFVGHASEGAAVYASVAETDTAWHCGRADGKYRHPQCRNANSIGIELCCHFRSAEAVSVPKRDQDKTGRWYIDPETVDAAVELARDIVARYGIPEANVLRHYDVTGKLCPRPWVEDTAAWEDFKARLYAPVNKEDEDMTKVYTAIEEVPEWAQDTVRRAMRTPSRDGPSGAMLLQGDQYGRLHLTDEAVTTLELLRKAGLLARQEGDRHVE